MSRTAKRLPVTELGDLISSIAESFPVVLFLVLTHSSLKYNNLSDLTTGFADDIGPGLCLLRWSLYHCLISIFNLIGK